MSIKMLVADDSITIQKVISIIFGGDDYSLTIVDNGNDAVTKAREINPDILLIDTQMPGLTGYEVAESVRSTPSLAGTPIVLLTGSFEPFDEEKAKRSGIDTFITKPFESQQIINTVKELLAQSQHRFQPAEPALRSVFPEQFSASPALAQEQSPFAQSAAPADIWGAFTPSVDDPLEAADTLEPDFFDIITEENNVQNKVPAPDRSPLVPDVEQAVESEFGDIVFEDDMEVSPSADVLAEAEILASDAVPPPAGLITEEQLKAALSTVSKEVIERIVWEVVPDLAEQMIREAIRKIKEGV